MEEKKLDLNTIIGFILIAGLLLYMLYQNAPTQEQVAAEKAKQEQIETRENEDPVLTTNGLVSKQEAIEILPDSLKTIALKNKFGAFAYSEEQHSTKNEVEVENEVLKLKFSKKGGQLTEVRLKKFVDYDSIPIYLVKQNNASFNINFGTTDNRILNTQDLTFQPTVVKNGDNQIISMKLKVSESQFLEYKYILKPNDYMIEFTIKSQGLSNLINSSHQVKLDWKQKTFRHDKSISYENRYTRLTYQHDEGKVDKLSPTGEDEEIEKKVEWLSFRQHFFSSILVTDNPFKAVTLSSKDLVKNEEIDTVFTKMYQAKTILALKGNEFDESLGLYYGPTQVKKLKPYDRKLEESVPLGWGIFGWINKYLFIPLFSLLIRFLPHGIAIVVMTVIIKLAMSFVQYKQYLSQMKMKILKPEMDLIREKYKDNKMKAQQETLALQNKAGASPLSGCLPALIQMPVFYALFMFFPTAFVLRQKKFLWADDLSSYDVIAELPFNIPFYGDHVSLFPILAAIAIFFYMRMTSGQQVAAQPKQEGMPDMGKMMKYMIYFAPLMMLVFFNQYASGLSIYYFISNLISIGVMIVIKNFILDEEKIHAQIQLNKSKPKKESKFQKKMKLMMEQAEQQKKAQQRKKK